MRLLRIVMPLVLLAAMLFLVTAGCRRGGGSSSPAASGDASDRAVVFGRVLAATSLLDSSLRAAENDLLPVAGAEVWLEGLPFFPHRLTNASGEYIFENIPVGSHRIVASFAGRLSGRPLKARSDLQAAGEAMAVEVAAMTLLDATKGASGILRDAAGTPWPAGTRIVIWGEIVTVLAGGVFVTPPLPPAESQAELSLLPPSASTAPTSVPASSTVTIPLVPRGTPVRIDVTVPAEFGGAGSNRPPVLRLTASKTTLLPGERISCVAAATDPDAEDQGKPMNATWTATAGTIVPGQADAFTALFTAPPMVGPATVSVAVSDPRGATSLTSLRMTVSETGEGGATEPEDVYDITPPTVTLSSSAPVNTSSLIPVTITFSEDITGFGLSKLTVGNGIASNIQETTAKRVYSCIIVPSAVGTVTVDLAAGSVADAAGNPNLAASQLTRVYGVGAPTVAFTSTASETTNTVIPLKITFSEEVIGFQLTKLTVRNGVASDRRMPVSSLVYTCNVTPLVPGTVTVDLEAGMVVDVSGNGNIAAPRFTRIYDSRPSVTLSTAAPAYTNTPIPLTIAFDESVFGFEPGKLSIVNGTVGNFQTLVPNGSYSCYIFPAEAGTVTVDLPAGAVTDSAGNTNSAARQILRIYDDILPTVAFTSTTPYATNATIALTITFSEEVVDFDLSKLLVDNGTVSDLQEKTTNRVFSATLTPHVSGMVTVDLFAGGVKDIAGNGNITATQFSRLYDNIPPDNQDAVLATSWTVQGSEFIDIASTGDAYNSVWLAPNGTKTFIEGQTMTRVHGEETSIRAPALEGQYRLFIADLAGNVSSPSAAIVSVDNTAPSNQNTVLAGDQWVRPGTLASIFSSEDTGNTVWLAPYGTTLFSEGPTITSASGTARSIKVPEYEGNYRIYIIDSVGNISQPSTAQIVADGTPPEFTPGYPQSVNVLMTTADVLVKMTEGGYVYFRHYTTEQPVLTAASLQADGSVVPMTGGVQTTINLSGLSPNTTYYAYFAIEDLAGNLSPDVFGITFETSTLGTGN